MPRTPITRRQLMKGAAATATALAFPTIIPSSALGDDKVAAPSNRITLGFIGIGKQASGHLNSLLGKTNTQVLAVCDVHAGRLKRAKDIADKKYVDLERKGVNPVTPYGDFHELLARKDIDAVVIGVPDHWHTIPIIEACKAKKDIYCEKPLTLTIHEAKTVIEAVQKHDRVFQTGSQQRSEGPFRQAVDLIRNGRIGKVKEVHVGVGVTSKPCDLPSEPTPDGINWDMWLGQAPQRGWNDVLCRKESDPSKYPFNPGWRDYREFSGGYITDWGAHHFDITQWALDMDHGGPVEILPPTSDAPAGYGAKWIYRGSPVGDEIVCTHVPKVYTYKDERTGQMKSESNGILFIGDKGKIFVNRSVIKGDPQNLITDPLPADAKLQFKSPGHRENWIECIGTRKQPICGAEIGARSVTVCHLVNLAYWHGQKLQWDPSKWEFTGDNAAEHNKWRDRERRAPYTLPAV